MIKVFTTKKKIPYSSDKFQINIFDTFHTVRNNRNSLINHWENACNYCTINQLTRPLRDRRGYYYIESVDENNNKFRLYIGGFYPDFFRGSFSKVLFLNPIEQIRRYLEIKNLYDCPYFLSLDNNFNFIQPHGLKGISIEEIQKLQLEYIVEIVNRHTHSYFQDIQNIIGEKWGGSVVCNISQLELTYDAYHPSSFDYIKSLYTSAQKVLKNCKFEETSNTICIVGNFGDSKEKIKIYTKTPTLVRAEFVTYKRNIKKRTGTSTISTNINDIKIILDKLDSDFYPLLLQIENEIGVDEDNKTDLSLLIIDFINVTPNILKKNNHIRKEFYQILFGKSKIKNVKKFRNLVINGVKSSLLKKSKSKGYYELEGKWTPIVKFLKTKSVDEKNE